MTYYPPTTTTCHWRHLYSSCSPVVVTTTAEGRQQGGRHLDAGASPQRQSNRRVESNNRQHRHDEQRERVREKNRIHHCHAVRLNVADERVGKRRAVAWIVDVEERTRVDRERDGRSAGYQPDDDDHAARSLQVVVAVGTQRVADGEVALDGKCRDCQHACCCSHLGEKRLEEAVRFAEAPRISFPDRVQFRRQS